jgi:hypothetical protein
VAPFGNEHGKPRKRPWLAALLAIIYPGLGHLYLREWVRAILWFGVIVSAIVLLLPESAIPETFTVEAYLTAAESIPLRVSVAIIALSILSVFDAYYLAQRTDEPPASAGAEDMQTCPNCGKELDADLDFCHWCTTRLDVDGEEADEPTAR